MTEWRNLYRPRSFKTFYGNESTVEQVQKQLQSENMPHTWLITGDTNNGKTTLARIIARTLLEVSSKEDIKQHRDYQEENIAVDRSLEKMRQIADSVRYLPKQGKYKVVVLDECHKLLDASASALLKCTEEPPDHVVFILATNEPDKLLKTLRNRAYRVHLGPLTVDDMEKLIARVSKLEQIKFMTEDLIKVFAQNFDGQPRQALTVLQALANSHQNKKITKEEFTKAIVDALDDDNKLARNMLVAIYKGDYSEACKLSQTFADAKYTARLLQDMNHYLICRSTNVPVFAYAALKLLWNEIKNEKTKLNLPNLLIVQEQLLELQKELTLVNINDPKHVMLFYLSKALIAIK